MPRLDGIRLALLEARRSSELSELVRRLGGVPYAVPAVREVPQLEEVPAFLDALHAGRFSMIVCLTGVGVSRLLLEAQRLGRLDETLAALARNRRLSLDGQGLVRPARTGLLEPDGAYDPEVLRFVSILKIADDEAAMLVDGYDERALARLGVPEIVVTLGSRGCIVYHNGVAELIRSRRVEARDPTGAGDAFAATYLAARSAGAAPTAAARRAAALVADVLAGRTS